MASRSGPGRSDCASSFSRKACIAKRSCNGSLGCLDIRRPPDNQIELAQIVLKVFECGAAYGPNSDVFRVGRGVQRWRSDHRRHRSQD